ncbi:hypothetical protein KXW51_000440 [Aspergillus fumigatus]|nr:hypothetical protein KXW51_000440 [Aspergillus fumigatus]
MILHAGNLLWAGGIITIAANAEAHYRRRCAYGDDCWPDSQTWNDFNATVGGRLIQSFPSAAVCHTQRYNAIKCDMAKRSWLDSFWRANQTGAYSATVWEMGNTGQCFIDTPVSAPCDQGLVPYFSIRANSVEDIQKTVKFAGEKDLSLVIKNTGHDHLGRSSGKGALSIWTHNLKGIDWHDSFVPRGAPAAVKGLPAATLQAGEQWFDVYQAAAKQGVLIVGGSARTVGAAGGYVLGGGHSPFAHYYGLATDNVLEMSIVSADGRHRVINAYSDPEYFWAVRGGGGSAWGVVTSVTYKTHPVPQNLTIGFVQLNATDRSSSTRLTSKSLKLIPAVTDAGYTGYGSFTQGFQAIFLQPNGTIESFNQTFAPFSNLTQLPGVTGALAAYSATWNDYLRTLLQDPNIGTNIQDTSRLLTAEVIRDKADDLAELIVDNDQAAGFNFIGKVNTKERDNTAVHEIWKHSHALLSISVNWPDNATACEKDEKRHQMVQLSKRFTEIVGPDGGTYVNEASPYEPQWQRVFWGKKYERLLSVKKRVDPTQLFVCNRLMDENMWHKAGEKLRHVVKQLEESQGLDHEETLFMKTNLAYALRRRGEYQEAERMDQQAYAVRLQVSGPDNVETAKSLNNLALDLKGLGRFDEALDLEERALETFLKINGEGSRETQTSMNNLANSFHRHGRLQDAARLHERALALQTNTLGREHFETIITMDLLGVDYRELGQLDRALHYQSEALELSKANLGEAHATTIRCSANLATTYQRLDTEDGEAKALALLEQALTLSRRTFDENSSDTVPVMNNLAAAYAREGRFADAVPLLQSAYAWNQRTLGPDHPQTRASEGNLNYVMEKMGLTRATIFN